MLIVGGGPVGLSAALLLDRFDIPSVVLERAPDFGHHPKARGIRLRTMELFRQWGLEPELRRNALDVDATGFIYCESLAGEEIARTPAVDEDVSQSPTTPLRVAQDGVEAALRREVDARDGIELRLGTEVLELAQDENGVTARAVSNGRDVTWRASYAIAADGVSSTIRRQLGVELEGPPLLAWWQSIYWKGDITPLVEGRQCVQFFTGLRSGAAATVASVDGHERWITLIPLRSETRPSPPTREEATAHVERAVGRPIDIEVVDTTTWRLSAQVAQKFAVDRIFLAGDAAHALPPTGGFGMNTGVQDAHNLAWKLAWVLKGWARPTLLDTYELERRPIAEENAQWSVENSARFLEIRRAIAAGEQKRLDAALDDQKRHISARDRDLGFHYESGALVPDDTAPPEQPAGAYVPTGRPGHRAPHFLLLRHRRTISSLDLFNRTFCVLTSRGGGPWLAAAAEVAGSGIPLGWHEVGGELEQEIPVFEQLYGICADGVVLVRPDGHVGFRCRHGVDNPAATLRETLHELSVRVPARPGNLPGSGIRDPHTHGATPRANLS